MKTLILPTIALLLSANVFSQDILTLRSGVKYQVKLIEITDTDLRFKMYTNQGGPLYTISRNTFESIVYENGTREDFALIPQESTQTVRVNGYNISTSSGDTGDQSQVVTITTTESSRADKPAPATAKKATFGEVMGAILATGMIALDVAAKIENSKCTQRHQHAHNCRK